MTRTRASRAYDAGYVAAYGAGAAFVDTTEPTAALVDVVRRRRLRAGRAVEFGCGEGRDAIFLARRGLGVVAFDTSAAALSRARRRAREAHVRVRFVAGDMAGPFDFRDRSFDLAATIDSFHYVTAARDRTRHFREVYRILKEGGVFFFCNHVARRASRSDGRGTESIPVPTPDGGTQVQVPRVPYFVGTKAGYAGSIREAGFTLRVARVTRTSPIGVPVVLIVAEKPSRRWERR